MAIISVGVLGYIGILYHKGHLPEVWHIPPGTLRMQTQTNGRDI
jgi:hypothetical protein